MASIVTLHQRDGLQRTWVPRADEEWWLRFWGRCGTPAARLADYRRWGGFFPPTVSADHVMLRRGRRGHRDYRRFTLP